MAKKWYRIAGVTSVFAALALIFADLLLTYTPQPAETDMLDLYVLEFEQWRLYVGALLGVFLIPFYLAGYWLIFRALRPAGFGWSFAVQIIDFYSISLGFGQVHSFFGIRGIILQEGNKISEDFITYYEPIMDKLTTFEMPIVVVTYGLGMLVPSLLIMFIVLTKKTHYRKWMAFANVLVVFVLSYLSKFISSDLHNILMDISINTGRLLLFLMPTIILWNGERRIPNLQ